MAQKDTYELYSSKSAFFADASRSRKLSVKSKLHGMSEDHVMEWRFYLARRHFNGGSYGFQFTPECIIKLWEHYNKVDVIVKLKYPLPKLNNISKRELEMLNEKKE